MGDAVETFESCDELSADRLLPLVYDELRRLAANRMAREPGGHTLQPTALVHEAWLRLGVKHAGRWESREHFFNALALTMRRLLIERARRNASLKRGRDTSGWEPLTEPEEEVDNRLLLMEDLVQHLENEDPEGAQIVSLKFFAGLTNTEVAGILEVNVRTIERKWALLKVRLFQLAKEVQQKETGFP